MNDYRLGLPNLHIVTPCSNGVSMFGYLVSISNMYKGRLIHEGLIE